MHNFYITGNIADIKFWDLQSVEFEKIYRMTPLRKQTLQNVFSKDTTLQLYVLHICDFSDLRVWDHFRLSSKSVVDLIKKLLQSTMNANANLVANLKCNRVFLKSRPSIQRDSKRRKQGHLTSRGSPSHSRSERSWNKGNDPPSVRSRDSTYFLKILKLNFSREYSSKSRQSTI